MTTIVKTRHPLQVISMSNQPERRTSKRLAGGFGQQDAHGGRCANETTAAADYEQDGDFYFERKSKRTKTEETETVKKPTRGRGAAKERVKEPAPSITVADEVKVASATTSKPSTRKSSRRKPSVDAPHEEPPLKIPKRATRRSTRLSGEKLAQEDVEKPQTNGASRGHGRRAEPAAPAPRAVKDMELSPQFDTSVGSAKIALPMSDTPIINRNKEMRKKGQGNRRSSLGMRGRRASSLIESGQTAIPHREVDHAEFYKHIEAEGLTEPRRMKQLLTWCGERALSEKPPHGTPNSNAILGGKLRKHEMPKEK